MLVQAMLMLEGGGESCADIEQLRCGPRLLGEVCSDSTLHRAVHEITPGLRTAIAPAVAEARAVVWRRSTETTGGPVILDIDSSLVEIHSENKEMTGPTYKGGAADHVLVCEHRSKRAAPIG